MARPSVQRILINAAGFHNHEQFGALILRDMQILKRVAIDDEKVGIGADGDFAKLACMLQSSDGLS
ncbi:MAG: hypothetical protein AAF936_12680 [Pseudomonadota bacterium]